MISHTGDGGWALFWRIEDEMLVRVRFVRREDGRLEPSEMHIEGQPARLTGDKLRNIPLGSMEAWANGPGREGLIEAIDRGGPKVEGTVDRALKAVGGGEREPTIDLSDSMPKIKGMALRLRIPDGPKRPDAFYAKVAELYSTLAASGNRRPASEIAEANQVPATTVHRWIKEARARRLLASGRRGKAG